MARHLTFLLSSPKLNRPIHQGRGEQIMRGQWKFGDVVIETSENQAPWGPPFPTLHFADRVHRFNWLADVNSVGQDGEGKGRALCVSWTDHFGRWDAFAWRVDVTADRVINWLNAAPIIINPLDQPTRVMVMDSLARQVRHLQLSLEEPTTLAGDFRRGVALVLAGTCLPDGEAFLQTGLSHLETTLQAQLLADGGHVSRSPSRLADMLIDLHVCEDILLRMGHPAPTFLTRAQSRMQNMLKFLRAGENGLIIAHGGDEGEDGLLRCALAPYGEGGGRFAFAQLTGFHRITANDLTVHVDTGEAPEGPAGELAGAGCLAINVQDGPDRLITQIGATSNLDPVWRMASRHTAAHSTLQIEDQDSATFTNDPITSAMLVSGPTGVSARRLEEAEHFLLEAQHSGWRDRYGLIHRRRLYLSKDGGRLTGEDSLSRPLSETNPPPENPVEFHIRFQMHPSVQVQAGRTDREVFIGLEARQRVWRLHSEVPIAVVPSVYCGASPRRPAPQLVISSKADPMGDGSKSPNRVRWALTLVQGQSGEGPDQETE